MTVNKLVSLVIVNFDERGSNRRTEQEKTYRGFLKYTREVFGGRRQPVTLASILSFTTGSEQEPVLGFAMKQTIDEFRASNDVCHVQYLCE
ncbi:hypothetical protein KP79_PYT22802 [Mizuhopecten yessoensis]|uniref:Uncharacterized protein n=1 Tax=Mizuhopecten yessoensis TaxID=6573 RepID=A0A210PFK0_MIZYE|nr:hypothetical protein KP79_PYT22802 [Mizuhopecten yessoensis]